MTQVTEPTHNGTIGKAPPTQAVSTDMPLKSAILEHEAGDTYRLRLVANDKDAAGSLAGLPEKLERQGFINQFTDVWKGKHVLVVRKLTFEQAEQLTALLQSQQLLSPEAVDKKIKSQTEIAKEAFKRDTLKWSGRFAMLGSAAIAASGMGKKDYNLAFTGFSNMAADSMVAIYGNGQGEIDFDAMFRDMHTHFRKNDIDLPNIATPEKRRNAIEHVHDFIAKHPVDLNYGFGLIGSVGLIRSGMGDLSSGSGRSRLAKGLLSGGGSAAVILFDENEERKEKVQSLDYYIRHPLEAPQGLYDFVRAAPMRFKGIVATFYSALYFTDTLEERSKMKMWAQQAGGKYEGKTLAELEGELHGITNSADMKASKPDTTAKAEALQKGIKTLKDRQHTGKSFFGGKVAPYLSMLTGLSYISAALLATASSKNRDKSFEQADAYERMYAMAAQTLLPVPKEARPVALQQIAGYLSSHEDVQRGDTSVPKIIEKVSARLEKLDQSPWAATKAQQKQTNGVTL